MINYFKTLGESILLKDGFSNDLPEIKKKRKLLNYMTYMPDESKSDSRALALCFDTEKEEFWFELDKECCQENNEYFFAFQLASAPNATKQLLSFNYNDFSVFYSGEPFYNLKENKKKIPLSDKFKEMVNKIIDIFYIKQDKFGMLNPEKLMSKQKEKLSEDKDVLTQYKDFIKKEFLPSKDAKIPIILVKINGKTIMEDPDLKDSYIEVVWNTFMKSEKKNFIQAKCYLCAQNKAVVKEVNFPFMKFYGTANGLFFENLKDSNAHKSFAVCEDCNNEVLVGMSFTERKLRDRIFGIDVLIIPKLETVQPDFQKKNWKNVVKLLKHEKANDFDSLAEVKKLLNTAEKENCSFDMLFYEKIKANFAVLKLIADVEYRDLLKKMSLFEDVNEEYDFKYPYTVDWKFIRYALFPKPPKAKEPKIYRKEFLELLSSFINGNSVDYADLINKFTDIWQDGFNNDKNTLNYWLSPLKMNFVLGIFNKTSNLSGVTKMEGNALTKITNDRYNEFFEKHAEIYGNNYFRQGLFLLGTVINGILYKQKGKSSNFLQKLNFKGILPRRIPELTASVLEYAKIYNVYEEAGIWGNIFDRIQGIENSKLSPSEVLFYILSGISFSKYEGFIKGTETEENQKGENDDNK